MCKWHHTSTSETFVQRVKILKYTQAFQTPNMTNRLWKAHLTLLLPPSPTTLVGDTKQEGACKKQFVLACTSWHKSSNLWKIAGVPFEQHANCLEVTIRLKQSFARKRLEIALGIRSSSSPPFFYVWLWNSGDLFADGGEDIGGLKLRQFCHVGDSVKLVVTSSTVCWIINNKLAYKTNHSITCPVVALSQYCILCNDIVSLVSCKYYVRS